VDTDIRLAEATVAMRKSSLEKLRKDLAELQPGSDEHAALERRLDAEREELSAQIRTIRQQFVEYESGIYHDAYQHILQVVNAYVKEKGIKVVVRFNRPTRAEATNPREVAMLLNRPVVAYKDAVDISSAILDRLEKGPAMQLRPKPNVEKK
jgi:hypothetical protein